MEIGKQTISGYKTESKSRKETVLQEHFMEERKTRNIDWVWKGWKGWSVAHEHFFEIFKLLQQPSVSCAKAFVHPWKVSFGLNFLPHPPQPSYKSQYFSWSHVCFDRLLYHLNLAFLCVEIYKIFSSEEWWQRERLWDWWCLTNHIKFSALPQSLFLPNHTLALRNQILKNAKRKENKT